MVRELREELAITVDPGDLSFAARLRGPRFEMTYFVVRSWLGEPCNAAPAEHDALARMAEDQLDGLVMSDPIALHGPVDASRVRYRTGASERPAAV